MVNALLTSSSRPAQRGFTLVELSIALIVIGVIAGGLLVGRDMIRNAQIKNLAEERNQYVSAVTQFRERFNDLPGDFRRATELWGEAANCNAPSEGTETCNGNGDGQIGSSTLTSRQSEDAESPRLWQHLANAQLIEGRYDGVSSTPVSSAGGKWGVRYVGAANGLDDRYFDGHYGHILAMAYDPYFYTTEINRPGYLTPVELAGFDTKFDDGKPATGIIVAALGYVSTQYNDTQACAMKANLSAVADADDDDAVYNMALDGHLCVFIIRNITGR